MTIRVLFVDDEPRILRGLQRSLLGLENEFETDFAESANQALEKLAAMEYDVVVSDMRMPGKSGAELLEEVKSLYPGVARIIMSGHSDREAVMRTVGPTHQYLAKPCDSETLQSHLREIVALKEFIDNERLMKVINRIDTLPSIPNIYHQILDELQDENTTLKRIGEIIASDPAMTAKILKLVNSAYFGIGNPVSSPVVATSLLGLETIKVLVLSLHIFSQMDEHVNGGFPLQPLMMHSLLVGTTAQKLANSMQMNEIGDDAFTAGLLHDIGKILLAVNFPDQYSACLERAKLDDRPMWQIEHEEFGASHAEIAGYLFSLWGLPKPIVDAVTYHHEPAKISKSEISALTLVHLTNALFKPFSSEMRSKPQNSLALTFVQAIDGWEMLYKKAKDLAQAS